MFQVDSLVPNQLVKFYFLRKIIMLKIKKLVLTTIIGFMTASVFAQVPTAYGKVDCGQWLNPPSEIQALANKFWLNGYLTGINAMGLIENGDLLKNISSIQQAWAWMDKYCRDNPLMDPMLGGLVCMNQLRTK